MMSRPVKSLIRSLLLLLTCWPLLGTANPLLKPFDVTYRYSAGLKSAEVRVSLQPQQDNWLWRTEVSPTSFLSLFTSDRLYTDTRFFVENKQPRIKQINLGSDSNPQPVEAAAFKWSEKKMESFRKGKRKRFPLNQTVYDSNTIHLLAQDLYFSAESSRRASFYHKGKLSAVTIRYQGLQTIELGGKEQQTERFLVQRQGSDSLLYYYYKPGEMLYPLRMEHQEPQESTVVMTLLEDAS